MKLRAVSLMGVAALLVLMVAGVAQATILDFNLATSTGLDTIHTDAHPGFGSHVNAATDPNGFGTYLQGNGFTPDVNILYTQLRPALHSGMATYNDFPGGTVLGTNRPWTGQLVLTIEDTPEFFGKVRLNSFDVSIRNGLPSVTTSKFRILDRFGNIITDFSGTFTGTKTEVPLGQLWQDSVITIEWFGQDIGINNVNFDEIKSPTGRPPVPLPPSVLLFGSSLLSLAGLGRGLRQRI